MKRKISRQEFLKVGGALAGAGTLAVFPGGIAAAKQEHSTSNAASEILVPDVEGNTYFELLMFTCLQGLANRDQARVFLYYSGDDHPPVWLDWYRQYEHLDFYELDDPYELFEELDPLPFEGYVMVDTQAPITANLAANYAGIENLLPVTEDILADNEGLPDLEVQRDLRGRFRGMSRVEVYEWAFENQWPEANHARVANLGTPEPAPADQIPTNAFYTSNRARDYTVAERGFFFDLSSAPRHEEEYALKDRILSEMEPHGYVFGWHTARDLEIYHIRQTSKYGQLALGASTQADNFSFHSRVGVPGAVQRFRRRARQPRTTENFEEKIYLTFALSDGDSLNFLTRGAQNGQWLLPERGEVPFGWEVQALLADVGPGILDYFQSTATENDFFGAGVSGIGYTNAGAMSEQTLQSHLNATKPYLRRTGLTGLTVMSQGLEVTDRMRKMYADTLGEELSGVMRGYVRSDAVGSKERLYGRNPGSGLNRSRVPIKPGDSFAWLPAAYLESHEHNSLEDLLSSLETLAERVTQRPLFAPTHVVGHVLSVADIAELSRRLDSNTFEIVGPNEFYTLFAQARPGTVVAEPPEGEVPKEKILRTGEASEVTYTLQSFGETPIDVETNFTLTSESASVDVTREERLTLEAGQTMQVSSPVDIPERSSGENGQLDITVTADNVSPYSVSLPVRFISVKGTVRDPYDAYASTEAEFSQSENSFTINANGEDVWIDLDQYAAIYNAEVGLGARSTITTKVVSQDETPREAKAGILVKNDVTQAATRWMGNVLVAVTPENGFVFQWDSNGDGFVDSSEQVGATTYPCWLKLEKDYNLFTGYYSTDGSNWREIGSADMFSSEGEPDASMFVTAGASGQVSRAEFGGLDIK